MFDLALLVVFVVMAYRITTGIHRESAVLQEFKQSRALIFLVLLFPLGPLIIFFGMSRLPFPFAFLAAAACYVPALVVARRSGRELETAGTDRVQRAQTLMSQAFGTALAGLVYVGAVFTIIAAVTGLQRSTDLGGNYCSDEATLPRSGLLEPRGRATTPSPRA